MAVKSCRAILIAATLVVQSKAASCKSGSLSDPVEINKKVQWVHPGDVAPKVPSVGKVYTTLWAEGISSEGAECHQATGSVKMVYTGDSGANLTRGSVTCKLKAVRIERHHSSDTAATMFLDYQQCSGVPTRALVAIDLEKGAAKVVGAASDAVLDFVDKVCGKEDFKGQALVAQVNTKATEKFIGNGECKGKSLAKYPNMATSAVCRQLCMSDVEKYSNLKPEVANKQPDLCKGYSYNAKTKTCVTYKTDTITEVNKSGDAAADWSCKSIELMNADYGEKKVSTTPAPSAPRLKGVTPPGYTTVRTYHSKDGCFLESFDWISLHNSQTNKAISLQVPADDWEKLMELIPKATTRKLRELSSASSQPAADIKVDHAAYTNGAVVAPPVVTPPPVAAPLAAAAVVTTPAATTTAAAAQKKQVVATTVTTAAPTIIQAAVCTTPEYVNAIVTGTLVPTLVWMMVKVGHDRLVKGSSGKVQNGPAYESLAEKGAPAADKKQNILVLIGASLLVAVVLAFLLTQVLSMVLKPMCESSEHDVMLIAIGTSLATFIGCAISLYFFGLASAAAKKPPQLMMHYVDEDGQTQVIKPDALVHRDDHVSNVMSTMPKK